MNLSNLLDVKAICDTGSMRKAAEIRGVTQPTLSSRIAQLEASLGTSLFDRSRGRSRPTDLALFIAARAESVAVRGEVLMRQVRRLARAEDAVVRIGIGAGLEEVLVQPIVSRTSQRMPRVAIEFHAGSTRQLGDWLLEQKIDFAVCAPVEPAQSKIEVIEQAEYRIAVVARPEHPMFAAAPPEIHELFVYPLALPFTEPRYEALVREIYGIELMELPGRVSCTGYETIRRLLADPSPYFTAGPCFLFERELAAGRLRALSRELPFRHVMALQANRGAYPFPAVLGVRQITREALAAIPRR
jgi:DNA-binding transcriptional LysR family regulator